MGQSIVNSLAKGIYFQSHLGALEGGEISVEVMGSGVGVVYLRENGCLYERIVEWSCTIGKFPWGRFPVPQNFPIRNRITSGLSHGTIVREVSEFSD